MYKYVQNELRLPNMLREGSVTRVKVYMCTRAFLTHTLTHIECVHTLNAYTRTYENWLDLLVWTATALVFGSLAFTLP